MKKKLKKKIKKAHWLNLAWLYFQQHAQQRISYFNFFVIFSTILLTGFISSFQNTVNKKELIGIGVGIIQIFVAYIFLKIDERNRFLTKHSEAIIKKIEKRYSGLPDKLQLFSYSDKKTSILLKKNTFFNKHITHGTSYKYMYYGFIILGIIILIYSAFAILPSIQIIKTTNK